MTDSTLNELLRLKIEAAGATSEVSDVLAMMLRSKLDVRDDGAIKVMNDEGGVRIGNGPAFDDMSIDELIAETVIAKPRLFGKGEPKPTDAIAPQTTAPSPAPEGETVTARILRLDRERRDAAKALSTELNPWRPATASLTMQIAITAKDPARAARLKAEAGIA